MIGVLLITGIVFFANFEMGAKKRERCKMRFAMLPYIFYIGRSFFSFLMYYGEADE